jgi:hypothetical protein
MPEQAVHLIETQLGRGAVAAVLAGSDPSSAQPSARTWSVS